MKTIEQQLKTKKYKQPPKLLYKLLMAVPNIMAKKLNTTFTYNARPADEEGPIVMIANHASRNDYIFTGPAVYPKQLNYVVGYNEFFRMPTCLLLRMLNVIPKRNFTPDITTIISILRIVKNGGSICFMPEGMSSITGMAQPVMPGGGALLKKLGVPVYYSKICGGYLTYTKHCLDERVGKVEVTVDRMFSAEELKTLTESEIEDRMNRLLAHDDYIWNKEKQYSYNGKGEMAKNLNTLLYRCPKCNALYSHTAENNRMSCNKCGNTIEIDDKYNISPVGDSVCPPLVTDWTISERNLAAEEVRKEGFSFSEHCKIGILPEKKPLWGEATSIICGDGVLTLNKDGITFDGTLKGEKYDFFIPISQVPTYGMCTDISRFYTFVKGRFIEFYPDNNDVLYWDHLTEEMHRFMGGKWQNTEYRN